MQQYHLQGLITQKYDGHHLILCQRLLLSIKFLKIQAQKALAIKGHPQMSVIIFYPRTSNYVHKYWIYYYDQANMKIRERDLHVRVGKPGLQQFTGYKLRENMQNKHQKRKSGGWNSKIIIKGLLTSMWQSYHSSFSKAVVENVMLSAEFLLSPFQNTFVSNTQTSFPSCPVTRTQNNEWNNIGSSLKAECSCQILSSNHITRNSWDGHQVLSLKPNDGNSRIWTLTYLNGLL